MPPTKTATNVLVGQADMYLAPENTAGPADAVVLGGNWPAAWAHPGFSEEGLTFSFERDTAFHRVEEQSSPVFVTVNESTISVAITLAEDTLENMRYSFGGGTITTTAAGTGQIGKKTLVLSDDLDVLSLGFEGKNPAGHFRRVIIPRVVSVGSVEIAYRRSESKRMYSATFQAICRMGDIAITEKTANAS